MEGSIHISFFPFMAKGHTVPLLHLANLLHRRGLFTTLTVFITTPLNAPFIASALTETKAEIIELPFPQNAPDIPSHVESTDRLPSMAHFMPFIEAVRLLQPSFEKVLESLSPKVDVLISDGFLPWTNESALKFGIPRVVFYGMGNFSHTVQCIIHRDRLSFAGLESPEKCIVVSGLQNVCLSEHDLCMPFDRPDPHGQFYDFIKETVEASNKSRGMIVNSFYELEAEYFNYWNENIGPKAWCIGPLCLAQAKHESRSSGELMEWLDSKLAAKRPVVYVAFGTQAEVSEVQLQEVAKGLELSGYDFIFVVRAKGVDLGEGFKLRVGNRGKVVRDWVDQFEILQHEGVKGFVSHCGWNSVLESMCASVPILAWPMMAEQHLNAKFIVDQIRIGIRVYASDGTRSGLVRGEDLAVLVKELFEGGRGKEAMENVKVYTGAAKRAFESEGSSWNMLQVMIEEVSGKKIKASD